MSLLAVSIPLLQSLLWVALIGSLFYYFRGDIQLLRDELQKRIKAGEQLKLGPLELQKIAEKIDKVEEDAGKHLGQVEQRLDWTEEALHQIIAYRPGYFAYQTLCQIRDKTEEYYNDGNAHKKRILLLLLDNGYLGPPPGKTEVVFSMDQNDKRLSEIAALTPMAELMLKFRDQVSRRPTDC
jgi:hypothetical protein